MKRIVYEIIKELNILIKLYIIQGFKILCSGRFTRKQRSSFFWRDKGNLLYSNLFNFMDYNSYNVILSNSMCTIKVWLVFWRYKLNSYIFF